MAKTKAVKRKKLPVETDSAYLLKMVMYLIIGSLWIKISRAGPGQLPIPIGFIVGVLFAMHDQFRIDRKIEYALLLVAMFIGFWLPVGIFVSL